MAHSKLYVQIMNSREWHAMRSLVIQEQPICQVCKARGIYTPSRCVHHIVPVESAKSDREAWAIALQRENCQALCYECHAEMHKAERSHSRAGHQQRASDRLAAWVERHKNK